MLRLRDLFASGATPVGKAGGERYGARDKVRDGEGAIASARGARASQNFPLRQPRMRSGLQQNGLRDLCDLCGERLINEKAAHFLKHLVEFRGVHLSNRVKNDVVFKGEKSLRTNEAWLADLAAFTIATIQWNGERIPVRAARDLTQNQIRAWKIGNHQSGTPFFAAAISARKRNDNDFAGYRFDHAASSSGEFQSRPRTDSLSSAPLNISSRAFDASSSSISSLVLIKIIALSPDVTVSAEIHE